MNFKQSSIQLVPVSPVILKTAREELLALVAVLHFFKILSILS